MNEYLLFYFILYIFSFSKKIDFQYEEKWLTCTIANDLKNIFNKFNTIKLNKIGLRWECFYTTGINGIICTTHT